MPAPPMISVKMPRRKAPNIGEYGWPKELKDILEKKADEAYQIGAERK